MYYYVHEHSAVIQLVHIGAGAPVNQPIVPVNRCIVPIACSMIDSTLLIHSTGKSKI